MIGAAHADPTTVVVTFCADVPGAQNIYDGVQASLQGLPRWKKHRATPGLWTTLDGKYMAKREGKTWTLWKLRKRRVDTTQLKNYQQVADGFHNLKHCKWYVVSLSRGL